MWSSLILNTLSWIDGSQWMESKVASARPTDPSLWVKLNNRIRSARMRKLFVVTVLDSPGIRNRITSWREKRKETILKRCIWYWCRRNLVGVIIKIGNSLRKMFPHNWISKGDIASHEIFRHPYLRFCVILLFIIYLAIIFHINDLTI